MTRTDASSLNYWAAERDSAKFVQSFCKKLKRYRDWLTTTGRAKRMVRMFRAFYGWAPDGWGDTSELQSSGEQGEWVDLTTNDLASLVQQTLAFTTANKPAFKANPSNRDFESIAQTEFAQGLLEHCERKMSLSEKDYDAALSAVLTSEGWEVWRWAAAAGRIISTDSDGRTTTEGDAECIVCTPFDVAFEPDAVSVEKFPWFGFADRANRHDLAALFPDIADALRSSSASAEGDEAILDLRSRSGAALGSEQMEDMVSLWEVRHPPSPALPTGRLVIFVNSSAVLYDSMNYRQQVPVQLSAAVVDPVTGAELQPAQTEMQEQVSDVGYPYPHDDMLAYRIAPEKVLGAPAGHSGHFDLLSLQECMDTVATMAATAANAGGVTNLFAESGNDGGPNLSYNELAGGLNVISGPKKPEVLEGVQLDPQVVEFASFVEQLMRRRIGMNDAALGEPTKGMPAQLAALLQSQAVQFHNRFQASFRAMLERSRTGLLKLYKRFARTKRVADIGGKANSWQLRVWTAEDLSTVERVTVESVNPVLQTTAGKLSFADMLLERSLITPQQYMTLVDTGKLEAVWDYDTRNLARITREKELLQQGVGLPPVDPIASQQMGAPQFIDDGKPHIRPHVAQTHWLDIPEYLSVIATPEAMDRPELVKTVLDLVHYKLELWRQMDAGLLVLLKGPPPPPPGPAVMMGMMGAGGPPPGGGDTEGPSSEPPTAGPDKPIKKPNLPKPPPDPATGEQPPAPPMAA